MDCNTSLTTARSWYRTDNSCWGFSWWAFSYVCHNPFHSTRIQKARCNLMSLPSLFHWRDTILPIDSSFSWWRVAELLLPQIRDGLLQSAKSWFMQPCNVTTSCTNWNIKAVATMQVYGCSDRCSAWSIIPHGLSHAQEWMWCWSNCHGRLYSWFLQHGHAIIWSCWV